MRAAATGALDYSQADPKDINWRIRQRLILTEISRRDDLLVYTTLHNHWRAYVAHGGLTEESYADVKTRANQALVDIERVIYPWLEIARPETPSSQSAENKEQKDTIDAETRTLIEKYKRQQAEIRAAE